jgi:hypothetical protein
MNELGPCEDPNVEGGSFMPLAGEAIALGVPKAIRLPTPLNGVGTALPEDSRDAARGKLFLGVPFAIP